MEGFISRRSVSFLSLLARSRRSLAASLLLLLLGFGVRRNAFSQSVLAGDVNGDGKVNLTDLVLLQRYLDQSVVLDARQLQAADADYNGKVNESDRGAMTILFQSEIENGSDDFTPLAWDAPDQDGSLTARLTESNGVLRITDEMDETIQGVAAYFSLIRLEDGMSSTGDQNFTGHASLSSLIASYASGSSRICYELDVGSEDGDLRGMPIDLTMTGLVAPSHHRPVPVTIFFQACDYEGNLLRIGMAPPLEGDANGDGVVDLKDVVLSLKIAVGLETPTLLNDANGDGNQDLRDTEIILRIVLSS